jgi:hypothetical protein
MVALPGVVVPVWSWQNIGGAGLCAGLDDLEAGTEARPTGIARHAAQAPALRVARPSSWSRDSSS